MWADQRSSCFLLRLVVPAYLPRAIWSLTKKGRWLNRFSAISVSWLTIELNSPLRRTFGFDGKQILLQKEQNSICGEYIIERWLHLSVGTKGVVVVQYYLVMHPVHCQLFFWIRFRLRFHFNNVNSFAYYTVLRAYICGEIRCVWVYLLLGIISLELPNLELQILVGVIYTAKDSVDSHSSVNCDVS